MRLIGKAGIGLLVLAAVTTVSVGCTGTSRYDVGDPIEPEYNQFIEDEQPVEPEDSWGDEVQRLDEQQGQRWSCSYVPTMNRDWHDDVLCTNGRDYERPYLLAGDDFVTDDEISAAAREFEAQLNAGK